MKCFRNITAYTEEGGFSKCDILFGRNTERILFSENWDYEAEEIILPEGVFLLPGFIDVHVHGGGGAEAMDGTQAALERMSETLAREGVCRYLATTYTERRERIEKMLSAVAEYYASENKKGARILGIHLEGPFLSSAYKGGQAGGYIEKADVGLFERYNRLANGGIRLVTLAPETEGMSAFIKYLVAQKVVVSLGHSAMNYAQFQNAVALGAKSVTHTYNAMSGFHHRDIGAVGGALLEDGVYSELIADTVHVSVPAMKLLAKCKLSDKLVLVTDAVRAKGSEEKSCEQGGRTVFVQGGAVRLADGTLSGSILTMNKAVKNLTEKAGVPFLQAVDCASKNPAALLGVENDYGSIRVGKRADYVAVNKNLDVLMTICDGEIVWKKNGL